MEGVASRMHHYMPLIFWHDREAILCVDVLQKPCRPSSAIGRSSQSASAESDVYKIVTSSVQKEVRVWEFRLEPSPGDAGVKQLCVDFVANLTAHNKTINIVRWSRDGEFIASGDVDGFVYLWKIQPQDDVTVDLEKAGGSPPAAVDAKPDDLPPNKENWTRARLPIRHDSDVTALAWSPEDNLIASASTDESVSVHNAVTGKRVWSTRGLRNYVNGLAWDPCGKYLVTLSTDRRLDILDAAKGTRLRCSHSAQLPSTQLTDSLTLPEETYKLFHDDQLISFVRYPEFSPCGDVVFAPVAHLEFGDKNVYGTYFFKRADFDKCRPTGLLPSLKPTVMVKCSPVAYKLLEDDDENFLGLSYRLIYAVMSKESILLYDSQHALPIGFVDNLNYFDLTSISWTPDGKVLVVSSQEGFNTFLAFDAETFGEVTALPQRDETADRPQSPKLVSVKKPKKKADVVSPPKPTDEAQQTPARASTSAEKTPDRTPNPTTTPKSSTAAKTLFNFWGKTPKAGSESPSKPVVMQPLEPLSDTKKDAADAPPTTPVRPTPAGKKRVKVITLEE